MAKTKKKKYRKEALDPGPYSFTKVSAAYEDARGERTEWEADWRQVSENLLPGRGIYQTYAKPRKRKLTSARIINTTGEDALYVLTSGMHGALTSPSRPWKRLSWADPRMDKVEPLKAWLQDCDDKLDKALHSSNFYSIINSFYIEYAGFGTGCMYVGEDSNTDKTPFRFELLTAGEYAFACDATGRAATFFRTIFMSRRQLADRFPDTVSEQVKLAVVKNAAGIDRVDVTVLEYVVKDSLMGKEYTRIYYEQGSRGTTAHPDRGAQVPASKDVGGANTPLEVSGFHEFPYPLARWGTIGSDIYGIGPGSRSLPHVKRLQEMEKAFLMATHKTIQPPTNVPARQRGRVNTLPGGRNYYSNPQEVITEISSVRFDFQGVSAAIERVEQRIQRNFFNDIFLTASRDPNASPLKATQVNVQEQEKMLRLGPVIERLQHEFFEPLIERCFNICLRAGLFEPLSPELAEMAGDYKITLVSPLAVAQRGVALQGINSFLGFIGQGMQYDPSVIDNVNIDAAVREHADISGVQLGILRTQEEVDGIRADRQKQQAAQAQKEEAMAAAQMGSQGGLQDAQSRKTSAEAGQIQLETQQTAQDMGMM